MTGYKTPPIDRANPLGPSVRRWVLGAFGVAALLALSGALVRLLPWLLDARISWRVTWVFARGLGAISAEIAALVALPLGASLAAASFCDRGEALACQLSGASPARLAARALWPFALALAALMAPGQRWAAEALRPASVAADLIEAARASCDASARPVSEAPGLGVSWLCVDGDAPWLLWAPSSDLVVQARGAALLPGGRVALREARWALRGPPQISLEVATAELRTGHQEAPAPPWSRWWLSAAAALLGSWSAAAALLRALSPRRATAAALGIAAALLPLLLRGEVDAARLPAPSLWLMPPLSLLPAALWLALRRRHGLR